MKYEVLNSIKKSNRQEIQIMKIDPTKTSWGVMQSHESEEQKQTVLENRKQLIATPEEKKPNKNYVCYNQSSGERVGIY